FRLVHRLLQGIRTILYFVDFPLNMQLVLPGKFLKTQPIPRPASFDFHTFAFQTGSHRPPCTG
ncbi:hypothetical protein RFZ44_27455, partial [Acinetobacter sp. 163]|nr:hypothetical protein [Acinetobacter sp. 163]